MKESNAESLHARSRECPHINCMLRMIRNGRNEEDAMVSAIMVLSGAVEAQNNMVKTIAMNIPLPLPTIRR